MIKLLPALLFTGAALLLSQSSWAQMPSYNYLPAVPPPPMTYGNYNYSYSQNLARRVGAGSYQLPNGSWHRSAKLAFDGDRLLVKDGEAGKLRLTADLLRQLVVEKDTFIVVQDLPGRLVPSAEPNFVRSCVNRQGLRLLARYYNGGHEVAYFLSRPNAPLILLPAKKALFKAAMLDLVKDHSVLAAKVAEGSLGRENIIQIIEEYTSFLRSSSAVR